MEVLQVYAIIATGGKQYRVSEGDTIFIEKLEVQADEEVTFPVLMLGGDTIVTGTPEVKGASVTGKVIRHGRGQKIIVLKYKSKKNYRRKQGHRQAFTQVEISKIQV
jgi:large subunit ribosomal protein L21